MYVLICRQSGEVRSDHVWLLEMQVKAHVKDRCELTDVILSTCDQVPHNKCVQPH